LSYLGLVEVLHGYPLDGVVLLTGCDKTTPACLMAAATMVSAPRIKYFLCGVQLIIIRIFPLSV
jgi:dihydroxyacid dehydratase/phosphogluconate dehydratase